MAYEHRGEKVHPPFSCQRAGTVPGIVGNGIPFPLALPTAGMERRSPDV